MTSRMCILEYGGRAYLTEYIILTGYMINSARALGMTGWICSDVGIMTDALHGNIAR